MCMCVLINQTRVFLNGSLLVNQYGCSYIMLTKYYYCELSFIAKAVYD